MPRVIHFEMCTDDLERVRKFYQDVFGWQFSKWTGPQEHGLVTDGTGAAVWTNSKSYLIDKLTGEWRRKI